ncbi:hypothetical protein JHK87_049870 [Glycine soja]|nr:hypothetical protein JHK87_049870 [Glycine soja]
MWNEFSDKDFFVLTTSSGNPKRTEAPPLEILAKHDSLMESKRSYDRELDTFRHYFLVGASFALTLILHEKFIVQEYLNHFVSTKRLMYERFALLFSMASAWLLAKLLTSSTAYNHKPKSTQNSCRTDRVGLIIGYEW